MRSAILTHARFQRPPIASRPRRGRYPRGVTRIQDAARLRLGSRAELVLKQGEPDNGKHVRIVTVKPSEDYPIYVESLDGPPHDNDGSPGMDLWVKPHHLRRLWTGLTENERIRLRLWRGAP